MNLRVMTVAALACVSLAACGTKYYPMPVALPTDATAMTCPQLQAERDQARQIEHQIEQVAAGQTTERPALYSTARSDADRAVAARLQAIGDAMTARGCAG